MKFLINLSLSRFTLRCFHDLVSRSLELLILGSQIWTDSSVYQSRSAIREAADDKKVGVVLRRYLGSIAANNQRNGSVLSSKLCLSDINSVLANPRNGRFFSSEALKMKNDDNFYPKEKKETTKGDNQKSESKGGSSREEKQNVLGGGHGRRSQTLTSCSLYQSRYVRHADDNLGVLKHFLGSLKVNNERNGSGLSSKVYISDLNSVLANHRIRRFFSSEAPEKKNDDDIYLQEKKTTSKGNNQKSESKEETSTEVILFYILGTVVVLSCLILIFLIFNHREETEIYFHQLDRLLKQGLVDHIVIIDKSVANVYVRNSTSTDGSITGFNSRLKHYINFQSIESFETYLAQAQEALTIDSRDHVPVWYTFK